VRVFTRRQDSGRTFSTSAATCLAAPTQGPKGIHSCEDGRPLINRKIHGIAIQAAVGAVEINRFKQKKWWIYAAAPNLRRRQLSRLASTQAENSASLTA